MDFTFTEEQQLLSDMVSRFVAREYTFEKRRAVKDSAAGWSREIWQSLADLGLLALNMPEANDDPNSGIANTMVVMNALGAGLLLEPYLPSAVVATCLIRELANDEQQAALLPAMADGSSIAVLAVLEPASRHDLAHVETRATRADGGFVLQGQKAVVAHATTADVLLVSARIGGAVDDAAGISIFAVPGDAAGLTISPYQMVDGQRGGDITLRDVFVSGAAQLGAPGQAFDAIERAQDIGIAALAAEAVGAMTTLIDITAEYLRTRKQFGQPIGRFQALQHRMAEMLVHCEQVKSISYLAAAHCTSVDASERRRACSAAKVLIARAGRFVRQQAVQLHGGMGMTDELNVSHYFKRLMAMEATFGDTDSHLERFASVTRSQ
jgi:alkylation response protein AidB-like acyl-CoA dehydrogenase